MLKLIFALVLAGVIAVGVYVLLQDDPKKADDAANQFENTSEIIEGAGEAVDQSQDLQNKINTEAQNQTDY